MITVAVGSRNSLDQAGLEAFISKLPGLSLVALDSSLPPQVLVWDVGVQGLNRIPPIAPTTALLLLIADETPTALPPGIAGLFSKDEKPEALGVAIRQVARGEQYLSPSLAFAILKQKQAETLPSGVDLHKYTEREREILALLAEGLSNKGIASRLYISVRTVEGHLARLYPLIGVHSRTEAILAVLRRDQTPPDR